MIARSDVAAQGLVVVTGSSGFVGRALVERLVREGAPVRAAMRRPPRRPPEGAQVLTGLDLDGTADWMPALQGAHAVVHCAARVHVLDDRSVDPLAEFRRINVQGTLVLASQAAAAGVRRFIFVSSIGVNGAETTTRAFQADDDPAPHTPYTQSKLEAEQALRQLTARLGMDLVIVRPPLVYGPDAPGNFGSLLRAVHKGLPLPFGAVRNRRSLVALDNLADLLVACVAHPGAPGQVFLVSDGEDVSTPYLIQRMAAALGRRARLWPVPVSLLQGAGGLLGKASMIQSLCGSLQVDIEHTRARLDWAPPVSMDQALDLAARRFLAHRR